MKKKSFIALILFCIFSHIYAEGYVGYTFFANIGKGTTCMKYCISPKIKLPKDSEEKLNKNAQSNIEVFRKVAENHQQIYINLTVCQVTLETCYFITKFDKKESIEITAWSNTDDSGTTILANKKYDDPYVAQYEYDRLCQQYIDML